MTEEKHSKAGKKKTPTRTRRSVVTYLVILFVIALLLLVLAYFMQERAYAQTAAQLLSMV